VKVSHSGITPVRIKRMSPLCGFTLKCLHMATMTEKEMECVENVEYVIGGDWKAAQCA
jgi:hypothetical protein